MKVGSAAESSQCVPTNATPHENGETCRNDGDCASCNCGINGSGERRCYGSLGSNDYCSSTYDCDVGACLTTGSAKRCTDVTACALDPSLDSCFADLALALGKLRQVCDPNANFSDCVASQCERGSYMPASQCEAQLDKLSNVSSVTCER